MSSSQNPRTGPPLAAKVLGIDHVTLVVADLARSRAFYCGLLGMEEVPRPGFKFPGMWFQAGRTQIHLILAHEGSAPAGFPAPADYASPGRTFHFAFEVPDAHAAADHLRSHGVVPKGEPRMRPDGCLQLFYSIRTGTSWSSSRDLRHNRHKPA